ncbi:MAG: cupin domain-containing protein [Bacillota bacterium]
MKLLNLVDLKEFDPQSHVKKELKVTENFKMLTICFEPGQAVPPCIMERSTAFYIVEGEGFISAGGEEAAISAGDLSFIESGQERQIRAKTRLVVLAIQYN